MLGLSDEKLLKRALAIYAGQHVVDYVMALKEGAFVPRQEKRELTMLFVDVAAFSAPPEGVEHTAFLAWHHEYLSLVTNAIRSNGGILDGYLGDSACAWWDRSKSPNDAEHACRSAIVIMEELKKINQTRGYPVTKIRMGIHSGMVAVGPYGSEERLRFGLIGDAVNLASQLCNLSGSTYDYPIILSGATQVRLPAGFATSPLGKIPGRGVETVDVFTVAPRLPTVLRLQR